MPAETSAPSGETKCSKQPDTALAIDKKPDALAPIDQVLKWMTEGQSDADIIDAAKVLWPELDPEDLHADAVEQLADATQIKKAVIYGWCLMARRELYRRMLEIGDFSGALKASESIEKLAGKLS